MMPPPLPASLSERLKSTIDPMTGNCKHHPSIQLCQLVANGTRWSIKRKVCIKCGSRTPVGGFDRRKPGRAVTNPGRPAPGKLNPKERAEADRKEKEEAFGTLREREARRLQKEMEAAVAVESAANSFDGPPSEVVAVLSSSDDSRTRSSDEDRFNVRQRSASRLRDNYRSRDSKGRDKEQRQGRQNRSPSRPRERQNRSPSRPRERSNRSPSHPRERQGRSASRPRVSQRHREYDHVKSRSSRVDPTTEILALLGTRSISDDEPEFDERRVRSASRPRDRNMRRDNDVDQQTRQQRHSSRPRERIEYAPSRGKEKSFRSKSSSRGRTDPPPLDYYEDYLVRTDRMAPKA